MVLNQNVRAILSKSGFLAYVFSLSTILLLSMHNQYMPPFIIAWFIFWFIDFALRNGRISEDEKKVRSLLFLFLGINLIFLIGLIFSGNRLDGSVLFFRRLSLLILPIILFSPGNEIKQRINTLLKVYVVGIISFMIFCFCYALFRSVNIQNGSWSFIPVLHDQPWLNYFFGQLLSIDQHPSYIAMYSFLGMFISFEFFSQKSLKQTNKITWLCAAVFLFISLYFLSSRASYLAIVVIMPVYLWIKFKPKKYKLSAIISLLTLLVLVSLVFLNNERVKIYFDKSNDPEILKDGRIEIWTSALNVIKRNPLFGVGIGDYYKAMDEEFKNSGFTTGYYKDFNAHNEYLEILCISGITGFILFLIIFGYMIYYAFKDRNVLYGVFILMILIFLSFESMLSRLAGNTFFALFSFLLIHYKGSVSTGNEIESKIRRINKRF